MFDLSIPKLLVLAVIALVIFGPNELPTIASQVGRVLRDLRKVAEDAKNDLRKGLGPEFGFEIEDLSPRRFVHKHLLDDLDLDQGGQQKPAHKAAADGTALTPGEAPPSDRTRPEPTGLNRSRQAAQAERPPGALLSTIQATTPRREQ